MFEGINFINKLVKFRKRNIKLAREQLSQQFKIMINFLFYTLALFKIDCLSFIFPVNHINQTRCMLEGFFERGRRKGNKQLPICHGEIFYRGIR